jgi:hypothetical protein
METLIYRISDGLGVGRATQRKTATQTQNAVIAEIANICNSELGGTPADYGTLEIDRALKSGVETYVSEGVVEYRPVPLTPIEQARENGLAKLYAIAGLTQDEIDAQK